MSRDIDANASGASSPLQIVKALRAADEKCLQLWGQYVTDNAISLDCSWFSDASVQSKMQSLAKQAANRIRGRQLSEQSETLLLRLSSVAQNSDVTEVLQDLLPGTNIHSKDDFDRSVSPIDDTKRHTNYANTWNFGDHVHPCINLFRVWLLNAASDMMPG